MTTDGAPGLPVIVVERPAGRSDQRTSRELDTPTVPRLINPLLGPPDPQPGDVFRNKRGTMRPLGLLPDRRGLDAWKELTMLLSRMPSNTTKKAPAPPPTAEKPTSEQGSLDEDNRQLNIEATVSRRPRQKGGLPSSFASISKSGYRFSQRKRVDFDGGEGNRHQDDREYLETLAHARSHMQRYYAQQQQPGSYQPRPSPRPAEVAGSLPSQQSTALKRTSARQRSSFIGSGYQGSNVEYLSFTEPSQLYKKQWFTDCRDGSAYEPCERCRLKGTRCSKCKVIRTGGGYIILDGLTSLDDYLARQRHTSFVDVNLGDRDGRRRRGLRGRSGLGGHDATSSGYRGDWGNGSGGDGRSSHLLDGRGGDRDGLGMRGGWDGYQNGGGDGRKGGLGGAGEDGSSSGQLGSAQGRRSGTGLDGSHRRSGLFDLKEGDEDGTSRYGQQHRRGGDDGFGDGDGEDYRDGGGRNSQNSARPRTGRRPPSSLRRDRAGGRGSAHDKNRRDMNLEGSDKKRRRRGGEGDSSGDDDSDDEGKRQRRRRHGSGVDEDGGAGRDKGIHNLKGKYRHDNDDDRGSQIHLGDLRRFKSKRDDVKAIACTLKELQGIDPLDYLAKYCIIDQAKLPEYERVFDNVDRDEDDEITIPELDFALKAVNYNLISDAEMTYVHSILELAGRYALNFRLFSLVAALSEKVVSLEHMVKRLINTMDFESLETKMKKCKELFYLLADSNDDGVVTTDALAVELQAGGLTEEHVDFVVDRLNHQGKGVVEFLDYLTYVPLFVEIHDSISDNPLNFTRTK